MASTSFASISASAYLPWRRKRGSYLQLEDLKASSLLPCGVSMISCLWRAVRRNSCHSVLTLTAVAVLQCSSVSNRSPRKLQVQEEVGNSVFQSYMLQKLQRVNDALERVLIVSEATCSGAAAVYELSRDIIPHARYTATIDEAMRHSLLAGGKRVRPILCIAACELAGGREATAMGCACAIEMIHTLSLIHDDLPCMDNDDWRRGKPTTHKRFGEGVAVLTGVALFGLAVEQIMSTSEEESIPAERIVRVLGEVSRSIGSRGMVGGQCVDMEMASTRFKLSEGQDSSNVMEALTYIHTHKTASLIECAVVCGAILGAASEDQIEHLRRYAHSVGLLFQVVDDILDMTQSSAQLGKTAGKDVESGKATFPAVMGLPGARRYAHGLHRQAHHHLSTLDPLKSSPLRALADYVASRHD